jgi:spermidine/putrescine transport system substrate-binding protein
LSLFYNGDALVVSEFNPFIKFVFPNEGTGLWVDYFTVATSSKNKDIAMKFIDYINIPKNAAQIAEYLSYASPNKSAELLLPESHLKNPLIYPANDVLSKSEFFQKLPPRSERKRNLIFSAITK